MLLAKEYVIGLVSKKAGKISPTHCYNNNDAYPTFPPLLVAMVPAGPEPEESEVLKQTRLHESPFMPGKIRTLRDMIIQPVLQRSG